MNKPLSYLLGLVLLVAASVGVYFGAHQTASPSTSFGAGTGPDLGSPYFVVGGQYEWKSFLAISTANPKTQATTTPCALQSPNATSTLGQAYVTFTVGTTSATIITIAKAATRYATTTVIGNSIAIAAGAQSTVSATTSTANNQANDRVFAPNQWLVIGVQGPISGGDAAGTGYKPVGRCGATWTQN